MARRRKNKHKNKPQASSQVVKQPQATIASQPDQVSTPPQNQSNKPGVSLQTIEQQRAKHALEKVNVWKGKGARDQKELLSYVTGMPALILMSGFGQTCAFYKANKKGNHAEVLNALESWLDKGDVMAFITDSSAQDYQLAQAESLAYLNWLKKFTKAYLKDNAEESNDAATA